MKQRTDESANFDQAVSSDHRTKTQLVHQLHRRVLADLEAVQRSHEDAARGVTHEDARQESNKDMRSTEASYIARGQAKRVVELQRALTSLETMTLRRFAADDPVALGALVTIELDDGNVQCFIAPAAGGMRLKMQEREIRVVTPQSPLGAALLGRRLDDDVSWQTPQGDAEGVIVEIV